MRKKVFGRHFSRSRKAREALFKSLIKAFILHGKIKTTTARAKAIAGDIDEIVRLARVGDVDSLRQISSTLSADRKTVEKFADNAESFKERASGFTRITRLPARFGDAAEMARLEWVDQMEVPKKEPVRQARGKKVSKVAKVSKVRKGGRQKGAKSPSEKV